MITSHDYPPVSRIIYPWWDYQWRLLVMIFHKSSKWFFTIFVMISYDILWWFFMGFSIMVGEFLEWFSTMIIHDSPPYLHPWWFSTITLHDVPSCPSMMSFDVDDFYWFLMMTLRDVFLDVFRDCFPSWLSLILSCFFIIFHNDFLWWLPVIFRDFPWLGCFRNYNSSSIYGYEGPSTKKRLDLAKSES